MKTIACIVAVAAVGFLLAACSAKKIDKSLATYSGEVVDYRGSKKLVVAFTASWASFWKLTEQELAKLDKSRFELCILDENIDREQIRKFGIDFLPTVALVENGKITKRVRNLASIDQIKDW
jgi:thioredoxin-like negative regulator of GroEL